MSQSGFGRKGVCDNDIERKKAAFIAAERARGANKDSGDVSSDADNMRKQRSFGNQQSHTSQARTGHGYVDSGISHDEARQAIGMPQSPKPEKSLMLAYVYWYFAGLIGAHRFYLGDHKYGLYQLGLFLAALLLIALATADKSFHIFGMLGVACLGLGFCWIIVDMFLIPGIRRKIAQHGSRESYENVFS